MRPLYFLLSITLPYVLSIFFRRRKIIGTQKEFYAQTILVCNHPSAFIDPLIIANYQKPIIHFMTRSDVFKPWLKPVTWACHMVPIYRMAEDGNDSAEKNTDSFRAAIEVLKNKKSLIMFGEGYTDDVYIRSLKPLKKGPARIAFQSMVNTNWQQDIRIQAIGVNYSDPGKFDCDLVISGGKVIHLKDYKSIYDESPARAMTLLLREVEKELQEQITYVKDKTLAPFVEQIMSLTRKGLNNTFRDKKIPLLERYQYSKKLASKVNESFDPTDEKWVELKTSLSNYFNDQKKSGVNDNWVHEFDKTNSKNSALRILKLIIGFPLFILGCIHNFIPYILVKTLVEKMFRRRVFWSGVKLILGAFIDMLFNLPVIWLFYHYVFPSYWLGFLYFITVPYASGLIAYFYFILLKDSIGIWSCKIETLKSFVERRKDIKSQINTLGL